MSHVFLVAAEDSGDALGADVIDALRAADPGVRISGIGGERMATRGASSDVDMSGLAVLGLFEGLKAYRPREAGRRGCGRRRSRKADPDSVVLIDSWGFMWRVARALKLRGVRAKRIKLIGPQVWATRPGRARVLAQWVDHLLCIHPFEQPFYVQWGLPTTVIGNPALHRLPQGRWRGLPPAPRHRRRMRRSSACCRAAGRPKCAAWRRRCRRRRASSARATRSGRSSAWWRPASRRSRERMAAEQAFPIMLVTDEAEKADAYAAMTVAIACSGTVTTELAAQGAAVVIGYKLGWITWALLRGFLFKSKLLDAGERRRRTARSSRSSSRRRFNADNIAAAAERRLSDPAVLRGAAAGAARGDCASWPATGGRRPRSRRRRSCKLVLKRKRAALRAALSVCRTSQAYLRWPIGT